jgi:hypothetical protein
LGVFVFFARLRKVAPMNTSHRSFRPLPAALAQSLQQHARLGRAQARAELEGLEVRDSSFDEWLAAGGDRRAQPRVIAERNGLSFSFKRG